jgi:hypothetical protein
MLCLQPEVSAFTESGNGNGPPTLPPDKGDDKVTLQPRFVIEKGEPLSDSFRRK